MSYYTALISAWGGTGVPVGVTGSGTSTTATTISSGMSTDQKLAVVNGWMDSGTIPSSILVSGSQLANCINWTEFNALTAAKQQTVMQLCAVPGQLLGGSGNTSLLTAGMMTATFATSGPTIANLTALAKGTIQPWWQANGYGSPIGPPDLAAAGGLS